MATAKFREASPYIKKTPEASPEDYLFKKYLTDVALKSDEKLEKVLGVAIFGLGRAGSIHMSNIANNPRVKVLYIVEDSESKWSAIKSYWKVDAKIIASKQAEQVYNDPKVEAVIVCSPTFTHEEIISKSLDAKKAVFSEKPIGEDPKSTAKCYEAAARNGKPLFCAFNRRFDPSYCNVRERLRAGEIGHAHIIRTTARDSPLPSIEYLKISGGIFHDCAVHDIDLITHMLGEYPTKVSVCASANIPEIKAINDFDTVAMVFQFPSGTVGLVDLSRNSNYGYDQRLEIFGPKGMIAAANEQPIHCVTTQYGQNGIRSPPIWYSFPSRFRNAYAQEMEQFIDVVHGKRQVPVHAKEILAVSKIASACEESARSGKAVDIKWAPEELPPIN
ncbi:inositol 2-dehydrogenase-like [Phymastichus coffea]|uniref:inositol 2-dehydrogenase-like n=1 Tax=Phymastichus coffea TaxID=108790 RepID=UPI00273CD40B|nr:inositol 2-dehydrogenase-like [Phymastichus coffea]